MRPWVRWLINHRMRYVVLVLVILTAPFFLLAYTVEAFNDWLREFNAVKDEKRSEK